MANKIIFVAVLLLELGGVFSFYLSKDNQQSDTYEIKEDLKTHTLSFTNPKPEKPTLREIIYYHIIEKPYNQVITPNNSLNFINAENISKPIEQSNLNDNHGTITHIEGLIESHGEKINYINGSADAINDKYSISNKYIDKDDNLSVDEKSETIGNTNVDSSNVIFEKQTIIDDAENVSGMNSTTTAENHSITRHTEHSGDGGGDLEVNYSTINSNLDPATTNNLDSGLNATKSEKNTDSNFHGKNITSSQEKKTEGVEIFENYSTLSDFRNSNQDVDKVLDSKDKTSENSTLIQKQLQQMLTKYTTISIQNTNSVKNSIGTQLSSNDITSYQITTESKTFGGHAELVDIHAKGKEINLKGHNELKENNNYNVKDMDTVNVNQKSTHENGLHRINLTVDRGTETTISNEYRLNNISTQNGITTSSASIEQTEVIDNFDLIERKNRTDSFVLPKITNATHDQDVPSTKVQKNIISSYINTKDKNETIKVKDIQNTTTEAKIAKRKWVNESISELTIETDLPLATEITHNTDINKTSNFKTIIKESNSYYNTQSDKLSDTRHSAEIAERYSVGLNMSISQFNRGNESSKSVKESKLKNKVVMKSNLNNGVSKNQQNENKTIDKDTQNNTTSVVENKTNHVSNLTVTTDNNRHNNNIVNQEHVKDDINKINFQKFTQQTTSLTQSYSKSGAEHVSYAYHTTPNDYEPVIYVYGDYDNPFDGKEGVNFKARQFINGHGYQYFYPYPEDQIDVEETNESLNNNATNVEEHLASSESKDSILGTIVVADDDLSTNPTEDAKFKLNNRTNNTIDSEKSKKITKRGFQTLMSVHEDMAPEDMYKEVMDKTSERVRRSLKEGETYGMTLTGGRGVVWNDFNKKMSFPVGEHSDDSENIHNADLGKLRIETNEAENNFQNAYNNKDAIEIDENDTRDRARAQAILWSDSNYTKGKSYDSEEDNIDDLNKIKIKDEYDNDKFEEKSLDEFNTVKNSDEDFNSHKPQTNEPILSGNTYGMNLIGGRGSVWNDINGQNQSYQVGKRTLGQASETDKDDEIINSKIAGFQNFLRGAPPISEPQPKKPIISKTSISKFDLGDNIQDRLPATDKEVSRNPTVSKNKQKNQQSSDKVLKVPVSKIKAPVTETTESKSEFDEQAGQLMGMSLSGNDGLVWNDFNGHRVSYHVGEKATNSASISKSSEDDSKIDSMIAQFKISLEEVVNPTTNNPVTASSITEKPVVIKPLTEEPIISEIDPNEPSTNRPTVIGPTTEDTITGLSSDQPLVVVKPTTTKPESREENTEASHTEEPIISETDTNEPITIRPTVIGPTTEETVTGLSSDQPPVVIKPTTTKPESREENTEASYTEEPNNPIKTYGMSLTGDNGLVWNDLYGDRISYHVGESVEESKVNESSQPTMSNPTENNKDDETTELLNEIDQVLDEIDSILEDMTQEKDKPKEDKYKEDFKELIDIIKEVFDKESAKLDDKLNKLNELSENLSSKDENKTSNYSPSIDEVIDNEKFRKWLTDWLSSNSDQFMNEVEEYVKKEVEKQIEEYFTTYNKTESLEISGELSVEEEKDENVDEDISKKRKDCDNKKDKKDSEIKIDANNVYGNSVGNNNVTNVFIFNVNKISDLDNIVMEPLINGTDGVYVFGNTEEETKKPDDSEKNNENTVNDITEKPNESENENVTDTIPEIVTENLKPSINDETSETPSNSIKTGNNHTTEILGGKGDDEQKENKNKENTDDTKDTTEQTSSEKIEDNDDNLYEDRDKSKEKNPNELPNEDSAEPETIAPTVSEEIRDNDNQSNEVEDTQSGETNPNNQSNEVEVTQTKDTNSNELTSEDSAEPETISPTISEEFQDSNNQSNEVEVAQSEDKNSNELTSEDSAEPEIISPTVSEEVQDNNNQSNEVEVNQSENTNSNELTSEDSAEPETIAPTVFEEIQDNNNQSNEVEDTQSELTNEDSDETEVNDKTENSDNSSEAEKNEVAENLKQPEESSSDEEKSAEITEVSKEDLKEEDDSKSIEDNTSDVLQDSEEK